MRFSHFSSFLASGEGEVNNKEHIDFVKEEFRAVPGTLVATLESVRHRGPSVSDSKTNSRRR